MVDRGITWDVGATGSETMEKEAGKDSPNVIRFFKIMFAEKFWKYLPLPPIFAQLVKHIADQEFQLEDSNGLLWPVKLAKIGCFLAFQKGWERFFKDHSLKEGQVLIFTYRVGGHFTVDVFGDNAMEIFYVNHVGPRNQNRDKTNPELLPQCKPLITENVQPREEGEPNDSVALGLGSGAHEPRPKEGVGDMMRPTHKLPTEVTEDMIGIIDRDEGCYGHEGQDILYDLSCFEMRKKTPASCDAINTDKINKDLDGTNTRMNVGITDRVNECSGDVGRFEIDLDVGEDSSHPHDNMGPVANDTDEICIEKSKKPLDISADPSHMAQKKVDVNRNEGEKFTHTFEKTTDRERNPSSAVKRDDGKLKRSATQMTANQVEKNNVNSGFHKMGISGKRKCPESAIPNEMPKKVFGERRIKQELLDPKENAAKAPMTREGDKIFLPPVKIELDLPEEALPSDNSRQFSAEVKSKVYLELPVKIPSIPGRRDRGQGRVVYIRDPSGRMWPMRNLNMLSMKVLVGSTWGMFCEANSIKLGDECRFQLENEKVCCYKVDVMPR